MRIKYAAASEKKGSERDRSLSPVPVICILDAIIDARSPSPSFFLLSLSTLNDAYRDAMVKRERKKFQGVFILLLFLSSRLLTDDFFTTLLSVHQPSKRINWDQHFIFSF